MPGPDSHWIGNWSIISEALLKSLLQIVHFFGQTDEIKNVWRLHLMVAQNVSVKFQTNPLWPLRAAFSEPANLWVLRTFSVQSLKEVLLLFFLRCHLQSSIVPRDWGMLKSFPLLGQIYPVVCSHVPQFVARCDIFYWRINMTTSTTTIILQWCVQIRS